ncbi:MAG: hypothetical protein EBS06_08650 [Proteobacteria bacterium]|nr:hypothetical protein [Pseudomonadota bacterium]
MTKLFKFFVKKISFFIAVILLTSCASEQKITEKNLPKNDSSFAVMSFFNERFDGAAKSYFSSRQFRSEIDWKLNLHSENLIKNLLQKENFVTLPINFDQSFFEKNPTKSLQDLLKSVEKNNKKLPNYYLILLPREIEDDSDSAGGSNNIYVILAELTWFSASNLDYKNLKYSDSEIFSKTLYKNSEEQKKSNFKITSFGEFGFKKTLCNFAFDLLLIDREKSQLIAFATIENKRQFDQYLEWQKFDSFSNFSTPEKNKISQQCLDFLDDKLVKNLQKINLINKL